MDRERIQKIAQEEYERALAILAKKSGNFIWAHPYKETVLIKAKTCFGRASPKGIVKISEVYLFTNQEQDLRETIRHELAHLIIGNKNGHNEAWQTVARWLGARPVPLKRPTAQVAKNMKRQWRLVGILEDGTERLLHTSHNQMSKYLAYRPTPSRYYKCQDGSKIVKFKYVRNK